MVSSAQLCVCYLSFNEAVECQCGCQMLSLHAVLSKDRWTNFKNIIWPLNTHPDGRIDIKSALNIFNNKSMKHKWLIFLDCELKHVEIEYWAYWTFFPLVVYNSGLCIWQSLHTGTRARTHLLASPVSTSSNLVESRWGTLRKVLSDPVDEELFGGLSCPAASCVVKIANVLRLILFHNCKGKCNKMISKKSVNLPSCSHEFMPCFSPKASSMFELLQPNLLHS